MKKQPFLYSLILILILWQVSTWVVQKNFLPSPVVTVQYMATHLLLLLKHMSISLYRILVAIVITVFLGSMVGIVTARNEIVDCAMTPLLYTLYPVPKIAFLPLLMLFLGLGDASKITLVALILFFQIVISVRDSVKAIHPSYFISIQSLGATRTQIYRHVILPAILPSLFTSLRISVGTSISVLFFAENFATQYGIGFFIMDSWLKLDYISMFAGIVTISFMGSALFSLLDLFESKLCRWS
ncbi:ABC transporter permease [Fusibacter ferrireducens]|uniref:ABC transporter permease subunit n=1 Tax=Fusibacter ferrireducens TaxID=2785058 RepID=A0ABR9ZN49_9FIRM|nr:ABC transporter permease subunit [Fusibacter ferrireducens]MBF4691902.1 ABC transporter permease subunit [Fusibacter ferrireducens]